MSFFLDLRGVYLIETQHLYITWQYCLLFIMFTLFSVWLTEHKILPFYFHLPR